MKKFLSIAVTAIVGLSVVSCTDTGVSQAEYDALKADYDAIVMEQSEGSKTTMDTVQVMPETEISMENVDMFLNADALLVDLRNFDDTMVGGHILGFTVVPFFDYLEGNALVRNNGWEYSEDDIVNEDVLVNAFGTDMDQPILLMCAGGTRAGYVKAALETIGYTNVHNVGGMKDYSGDFKVFGDESYSAPVRLADLEDGSVNMSNIDENLNRADARYVDLRNFEDLFNAGYIAGFEAVPFFQYLEDRALVRNDGWNYTEADLVGEEYLINVFGDDMDAEIFLMCAGGTRAGYVKSALETIGYTKVYNIGGFGDYNGENVILGDGEFTLN